MPHGAIIGVIAAVAFASLPDVARAQAGAAGTQEALFAPALQCEARARKEFSCAGAWNEVAEKASERGRWDDARVAMQRAMRWRREHDSPDPALAILDLKYLAVIEAHAGNLTVARDLLIDAMQRRAALKQGLGYAPSRFELGVNLAAVLRDLGDWANADTVLDAAIMSMGGMDKVHAGDRAVIYLAKARTAEFLGRLTEAEGLWLQSIAAATGMVLGSFVLDRNVDLAANLNRQGRFAEGVAIATRLEEEYARTYPDSPRRVMNLNNLAFAQNGARRFEWAVAGHRSAIALAERNSAFNPAALDSMRLNLASALGDAGDVEAGLALARRVFARARVGANSPELPLRAAAIAGSLARRAGDLATSLAYYRDAGERTLALSRESREFDSYSAAALRNYRGAWVGHVRAAWQAARH